jgi:hypothetical protein
MKGIVAAIILVVVIFAGGYFGISFLIGKKTSVLNSDIQDLKQRVQKMEEESKVAPLPPDADTQKIIKTVNALAFRTGNLENSFKKELNEQNELIKNQKITTDEELKKQKDTIDKNHGDLQAQLKTIRLNDALEDIKAHILKARMEIVAKNIGNAKTELEYIDELFTKTLLLASDEQKKIINELQASLKKAKMEIDNDLPSAINRVNSLWHETGKLFR